MEGYDNQAIFSQLRSQGFLKDGCEKMVDNYAL